MARENGFNFFIRKGNGERIELPEQINDNLNILYENAAFEELTKDSGKGPIMVGGEALFGHDIPPALVPAFIGGDRFLGIANEIDLPKLNNSTGFSGLLVGIESQIDNRFEAEISLDFESFGNMLDYIFPDQPENRRFIPLPIMPVAATVKPKDNIPCPPYKGKRKLWRQ